MFGKRIPLFKLFGFTVNADLSWLILAVLVSWSLAKGLFPHYFEGFSNRIYWWMGIAGAVGLFMSIIFHEFCHSLVARQFGLQMKGITLFIFGGVAEMESQPESPKVEFLMAIAGPISSVFLGAILYLIHSAGQNLGWSKPLNGVLQYLMVINFWPASIFCLRFLLMGEGCCVRFCGESKGIYDGRPVSPQVWVPSSGYS